MVVPMFWAGDLWGEWLLLSQGGSSEDPAEALSRGSCVQRRRGRSPLLMTGLTALITSAHGLQGLRAHQAHGGMHCVA